MQPVDILAIAAPRIIPQAPPTSVSVAASTRNWNMISRRVAPSALRTPISRVRSVTEIIMIATTPTPPTSRPIEARTSMTRKKTFVSFPHTSNSLSCVMMAKLLSAAGRSPRLPRM